MPTNDLLEFIENTYPSDWKRFSREFNNNDGVLTMEEQFIVFKYTEMDTYDLNSELWHSKGQKITLFGKYLSQTLSKLPNYYEVGEYVYRWVNCSSTRLNHYITAYENKSQVIEYGFISTSKTTQAAYQYRKNTLFRIWGKQGKDISSYSKHRDEQEVLFDCCTKFDVLEVTRKEDYTLITLKQL
jgi:hypothetical protein